MQLSFQRLCKYRWNTFPQVEENALGGCLAQPHYYASALPSCDKQQKKHRDRKVGN